MSSTDSKILSFEDARRAVEEQTSHLRPKGRELVSLLDASGRVLAEAVHADRDFPPFPRATRDGYAVLASDTANAPVTLNIVGEIRAGASIQLPLLKSGEAAAIMTGAAVPNGADCVVMVEYTSRNGDQVEIRKQASADENIVPAGAEAKRGIQLLPPGTRLRYAEIAVAASAGRSRLVVYGKPRVAILSTGDEVVDVDMTPGANQIRNSNSYSLATQVNDAGGEPVLLPIAPDEPTRLRELLAEGLESELLLVAGGVSLGKYDLVEQILSELGATFLFTGAQIQPGKPVVFGKIPSKAQSMQDTETAHSTYFFGLPGNPISTMVTFELFVKPVVEALAGATPRPLVFTHAKLKSAIRTKTGLTRFLPALISGLFAQSEVEIVKWQGSGDIAAVARANCYVVVPPDREFIEAGEWIPVLPRTC